MAPLTLQNMKNEKANAMRRFQFKRFLEAMFHFFNISATLYLFARSSLLPTTVHAVCHLYHHSMLLLHNPFFAFLLLNAIILFLFALSYQNTAVSASSHDPAAAVYSQIEYLRRLTTPEVNNDGTYITEFTPEKHEPVTLSRTSSGTTVKPLSPIFHGAVSTPEKQRKTPPCFSRTTVELRSPVIHGAVSIPKKQQPETPPRTSSRTTRESLSPVFHRTVSTPEKQQPKTTPPCFSGTTVEPLLPPILEETVTAVTETTTTTMTCRSRAIVTAANGGGDQKEVSEKKCYRRVQSERRMVVAQPQRELNRSNTGLELKKKSTTTQMQNVEQLSKEEFNRAVEDFIAKQKKMLWEEQNQLRKL